ncbi:MAG: carbohydrate ABC transporter permease [Massiliimalia sp.]
MKRVLIGVFLGICCVVSLFPVVYTLCNAFMSGEEIMAYYGQLAAKDYTDFGETAGFISFHLIPDDFSMDGFYQIFIRHSDYLIKFWNSVFLTLSIVGGQIVISCLAGYGFSKFRFPCRKGIFLLTIILMMMPYQVTLVSNYIVLDGFSLIDSWWSLILPGIFSPFGVFLMKQVMDGVPRQMMEAASLDGAGRLRTLRSVLVPCCKSGIVSLGILSFVDNWNMVEQPVVFLKNTWKYPLSVFLAQANSSNLTLSFVCGILAMIPVAFLFLFFEEELVRGISLSSFQ